MPHLKINSHFGRSPLKGHRPTSCLRLPTGNLLTIGSDGECTVWKSPTNPIYMMLRKPNFQTDGIICVAVVNTSNLIDQVCLKLVTIHEGNRLRLWKLDDGICVNVNGFDMFEQKIKGCCSYLTESRFIFLHSEFFIYVFDSWKMAVVGRIKLDVRIMRLAMTMNDGKPNLLIRDSLKKTYLWDASEILKDKWQDFRSIISNNIKSFQELKQLERRLPQMNQITECKIVMDELLPEDPESLKEIQKYLQMYESEQHLFDREFIGRYPQLKEMLEHENEISQSCMVFLNHCTPYMFVGYKSGRLVGLPAFYDISKPKAAILYDEDAPHQEVRFLNFRKNSLIVSYRTGLLRVFSLETMELAIQSQIKMRRQDVRTQILKMPLSKFMSVQKQLNSPIKYMIETHRIQYSAEQSNNQNENYLSLELQNKQVVVLHLRQKGLISLKGSSKETRIYGVLVFDGYWGLITQFGINVYKMDGVYERTIKYDQWDWKDYNLHKKTDVEWDYNDYKTYKKANQNSYLVNFTNRYLTHTLNYFDPRYGIFYETFGKVDESSIDASNYLQFYFMSKSMCESLIYSKNVTSSMSILKLHLDKQRRQSWGNTSFILHTDAKRQVEKVFGQVNQSDAQPADTLNSFTLIYPWGIDPSLDKGVMNYMGPNRSALNSFVCFQGMGTAFTIYFQPNSHLQMSSFLTSYTALSIMLYFITICSRDTSITDLMFRNVEFFTTKKPAAIKPLSLTHLAHLSIESNNNVVNAGCNLMISGMLNNRSFDLSKIEEYFILNLKQLEENKSKLLSTIEIYWMLVMGFSYIYAGNEVQAQRKEILINRLLSAIDVVNFERVPDLMSINLKVLNEGMEKWKGQLDPTRIYSILSGLFVIFFFYDKLPTLNAAKQDRKINVALDVSDPVFTKRMKQIVIKTIVYIANNFTNQFLQILKKESVNQQIHSIYPCSVIEVLRQYLKSQRPTKHLVFYIQLLLKCISPTTPQLRKFVQNNVTQTLYHLCTYKNISFNQPSQKIALLSTNHVFIYDLRTATKWRTFDIQNTEGVEHIVEMSPKGNYLAVLGRNLKIWRLSSSFWSGVLGAFSQGWTFEAVGKGLKWEESEASITVESVNPNANKVFTL